MDEMRCQQSHQQFIQVDRTDVVLISKMYTERKDHVKHPEGIDESQTCMFCSDVAMQPVVCVGPCKSICCRKCASNWAIHNSFQKVSCPKKCSTPWKLKLYEHAPIEMCCPYSKECLIPSLQHFNDHVAQCPHQPEEQLAQYNMKKNFLCKSSHKLQFFISTYEEMTKSICGGCGQREVIKSHCTKCKIKYCISCRPPLCTQAGCPLGHPYEYRKISDKSCLCDMCGMPSSIINMGMYEDRLCNFDVCQLCYKKLPSAFEESEVLKHIRATNGNRCFQGHPLARIATPTPSKCWSCEKEKFCWKECNICQVLFCVSCKDPEIHGILCEYGHKYGLEELESECMRCGKQQLQFIVDKQCQMRLCFACTRILSSISGGRRRLKANIYCPKNHAVLFYPNRLQPTQCAHCHTHTRCRFACEECTPNVMYCLACIPTDLSETCYFGDTLSPASEPYACDICGQKEEVQQCKRCDLAVCALCQEKSKRKEGETQ